jgi:hypothetical protein
MTNEKSKLGAKGRDYFHTCYFLVEKSGQPMFVFVMDNVTQRCFATSVKLLKSLNRKEFHGENFF